MAALPRHKCICEAQWMPDLVITEDRRAYLGEGYYKWIAFECPECGRRGPAVPVVGSDYEAQKDAAKAWDQERRDPDLHNWTAHWVHR